MSNNYKLVLPSNLPALQENQELDEGTKGDLLHSVSSYAKLATHVYEVPVPVFLTFYRNNCDFVCNSAAVGVSEHKTLEDLYEDSEAKKCATFLLRNPEDNGFYWTGRIRAAQVPIEVAGPISP